MLIFVPIPLFSTPLSSFIILSNIPNYRLPQNWALGAPKLAPNPPKMDKNHHIIETKMARLLIFVTIPPFSAPRSPFIIVSNTSTHWLP